MVDSTAPNSQSLHSSESSLSDDCSTTCVSISHDETGMSSVSQQFPSACLQPRGKIPWWLWVVSTISILLLISLTSILVITNHSVPSQISSAETSPLVSNLSSSPQPSSVLVTPHEDSDQSRIVYHVEGVGKAISITYLADDGTLSTILDVPLPWELEAHMLPSAATAASITIVGLNDSIQCSLSLDGVEVDHQSGLALTVCSAVKH